MKRFGGAHENVVAAVFGVEAKLRSHALEIIDHVISLLLRRSAAAFGSALDVYTMFISAGKEIGFDSLLSLVTRNRVGHDHRVEMTEVRQAVRVIDGGGDVEGFH